MSFSEILSADRSGDPRCVGPLSLVPFSSRPDWGPEFMFEFEAVARTTDSGGGAAWPRWISAGGGGFYRSMLGLGFADEGWRQRC
jgi:hypothetical protein